MITRAAIVVVSFNGRPWIDRCIQSCLTQTIANTVYLVDNASSDGTYEHVKNTYPSVRAIRLDKNQGFGAGNNCGISNALNAGHEYVLLLNQDAWLPAETLEGLVSFMDSQPTVSLCSPLHCSPDLTQIDRKTYAWYLATHAQDWLCDISLGKCQDWYPVRGVNAAIWFARATVFREIGGFDPVFFMYGEDDDFLDRLAHHHRVFAFLPHLRAVHLRESPKQERGTVIAQIKIKSIRERSLMVRQVKKFDLPLHYMLLTLARRGFVDPAFDWFFDRDGTSLLARWAAAAWVLFRLHDVAGRIRRTRTSGPHYLEISK